MMTFISAFVVCGGICLAGQLIYDNTKLTAGHITSIFVVIGKEAPMPANSNSLSYLWMV